MVREPLKGWNMRAAQGARALGALVPALGLSNKAVYAGDAEANPKGAAQGPAFPEGPDLAPAAAPRAVGASQDRKTCCC